MRWLVDALLLSRTLCLLNQLLTRQLSSLSPLLLLAQLALLCPLFRGTSTTTTPTPGRRPPPPRRRPPRRGGRGVGGDMGGCTPIGVASPSFHPPSEEDASLSGARGWRHVARFEGWQGGSGEKKVLLLLSSSLITYFMYIYRCSLPLILFFMGHVLLLCAA